MSEQAFLFSGSHLPMERAARALSVGDVPTALAATAGAPGAGVARLAGALASLRGALAGGGDPGPAGFDSAAASALRASGLDGPAPPPGLEPWGRLVARETSRRMEVAGLRRWRGWTLPAWRLAAGDEAGARQAAADALGSPGADAAELMDGARTLYSLDDARGSRVLAWAALAGDPASVLRVAALPDPLGLPALDALRGPTPRPDWLARLLDDLAEIEVGGGDPIQWLPALALVDGAIDGATVRRALAARPLAVEADSADEPESAPRAFCRALLAALAARDAGKPDVDARRVMRGLSRELFDRWLRRARGGA